MSRGRAVASLQNMRAALKRMDDAQMGGRVDRRTVAAEEAAIAQAWALSYLVEDDARNADGYEKSYDDAAADNEPAGDG